jgi:hypothetical protein
MAVFWVVAPCSLVKFTNVSEVLAASIIRAMEAARTSETLINFYQTTRRYNPEEAIFVGSCLVVGVGYT